MVAKQWEQLKKLRGQEFSEEYQKLLQSLFAEYNKGEKNYLDSKESWNYVSDALKVLADEMDKEMALALKKLNIFDKSVDEAQKEFAKRIDENSDGKLEYSEFSKSVNSVLNGTGKCYHSLIQCNMPLRFVLPPCFLVALFANFFFIFHSINRF
jgi:hypothetical protein